MDTNDLSKETRSAILLESEKFNPDLALQFGELAGDCKDEDEYLKKARELISEIQNLDADELEDVFFGSITNTVALHKTLDRIAENIEKAEKIPKEKRHSKF